MIDFNKKASVLIIEDELEIAELIKNYLEEFDFQVLMASSRNEAFFKINNQKFDCIVCDIKLANNDITPVLNEIRSNEKGNNFGVPIIIHSGNVTGQILKKNKNIIKGVLVKPAPTNDLLQMIKTSIKNDRKRLKAEKAAKRQKSS